VPEIARRLGMTIEDLKPHIEIIRNLDPRPGGRLNPSPSQYVIPDVYVVKVEDQYVAMLNDDGLPQLRISPVYKRLLDKGGENSDETRALREGEVPIGAVAAEVRGSAPEDHLQVATSIINFQKDFLDSGIEHLKPSRVAGRGERHRHARVRPQPRRQQQVHAHAARRVRDEVLLPQRHQQLVRRERLVGHDQAAHPEDHRAGRCPQAAERFQESSAC